MAIRPLVSPLLTLVFIHFPLTNRVLRKFIGRPSLMTIIQARIRLTVFRAVTGLSRL